MEKNEFCQNAEDMIYLTACAINGKVPEQERVDRLDLPDLFEVCQRHTLTACTAYALESAGIHDHDFSQAKEKAIRKNILLDTERKRILDRLESEHIWYMPLKGALLKDWYPKLGMRQMSDNDILCDGNYRAKVKDIMTDLGFACNDYGRGNDDEYFKEPVYNFEMHSELFISTHVGKLHEYYANVKQRLVKDEKNEFGYHFTNEDFYIYITAHEFKHFSVGGTGVRSLLDTYVFTRKFGDSLDWEYIDRELNELDIADYEKQNRELAMKVFSGEPLTDGDKKLLDYYILSGTYGTTENSFENSIRMNANASKSKYVLQRLFPSMDQIRIWHPFFYRHKWLIPVLWIIRPFIGFHKNRKRLIAEIRYISKKN